MLWKLLRKITPSIRCGNGLFSSIKTPLKTIHHFQCSQVVLNETVEKWLGTLPEDKQKRVRHIQNEVSERDGFDSNGRKMIIVCVFCRLLSEWLKRKTCPNWRPFTSNTTKRCCTCRIAGEIDITTIYAPQAMPH